MCIWYRLIQIGTPLMFAYVVMSYKAPVTAGIASKQFPAFYFL